MQEKWLQNFRASNVQLTATLFFGSAKVDEQITQEEPVSIGTRKNKNGQTVHMIDFHDERILFSNLDMSQYDQKREKQLIAVVQADYLFDDTKRYIFNSY